MKLATEEDDADESDAREHDTEESKSTSLSNDVSRSSPAPSSTTTVSFSAEDIVLWRLNKLTEEQRVSPMIFEAALQDYPTCSRLLLEGVDCDILDPDGKSLAHIAAMTGNMPLLYTLTGSSNRIWSASSDGKLPLDDAASNNHLEVVKYMIGKEDFENFAFDWTISILERALGYSSQGGHFGVVGYLVKTCYAIMAAQNLQLFQDAVCRNDIETVERLLKEGINDESAVYLACIHRFLPLVSLLLSSTSTAFSYHISPAIEFESTEHKPYLLALLLRSMTKGQQRSWKAKEAYGLSLGASKLAISRFLVSSGEIDIEYAFMTAVKYTKWSLLRWIIQKERKKRFHGTMIDEAFYAAVSSGSLPMTKLFVENRANVDSENNIWASALQCATANGNFELVKYLVKQGANMNAPGMLTGTNPLITAIVTGNLSMFHYFFDLPHSYSKDQHSSYGNILQTASYLGECEMVTRLLDAGFDINSYTKETGAANKRTPLGSALIMTMLGSRSKTAELLISWGADVYLTIPGHGSALHLAAARGIESIVKSLIQAGAEINDDRADLGTPLQAAAANGHEMIVLYLLDCGAKVNVQGGEYGNALQAAQTKGHSLIAKLLLFSGAKVIEKEL
jgi:ankyrin repeat protein